MGSSLSGSTQRRRHLFRTFWYLGGCRPIGEDLCQGTAFSRAARTGKKKWASAPERIVQGLKPGDFFGLFGTTEVVP
jgi:hypothetical protein